MFNYIWPIALVVLSNVIYHICAKSVPENLNPMASLTVSYLVGAVVSGILYFVLNKDGNLLAEYRKLNWAPFILGVVIVGLEVGFIYVYKAGWTVSTASIVQSAFLAVALVIVGALLFKEHVTWNTVIGIAVCLAGLCIINIK